jgi:glycosyltransferase involved in cell wall biosynthesis
MSEQNVYSLRPRVAVVGDDRVAAQIIARGVPGYHVQRGGEHCDLVHRIGAAAPYAGGVPVLVTDEQARAGAVAWHAGVDLRRFNPGRARGHDPRPGEISILAVGARREAVNDALGLARARDERLRLVVESPGLDDDARAAAYARADLIVAVDASVQTILEAQASGVAVIAAGGVRLVRDGHTGRECAAEPRALASAILALAADAAERARLGRAARYSTRAHSCEVAMVRLAALYEAALAAASVPAAA